MPASRALRASSGPAKASASTLTMTMCLPWVQQASTWAIPAEGLPVASITISISGAAISAMASSQRWVLPWRAACAKLRADSASAGQPVCSKALRARLGDRSATATRWMPGVRRACERYIDPNFPAPISPTRRGRESAARCSSSRCRFILRSLSGGLRKRQRVNTDGGVGQAIVGQRFDRGEVAMGDPVGS